MLLESNSGLAGDRSCLISKLIKRDEGRFITFDAYFNPADNSSASLVLELNHFGIRKQLIANIEGHTSWQRLIFPIPPGDFEYVFRGNMGKQFSEDIAIANIDLLTSSHNDMSFATGKFKMQNIQALHNMHNLFSPYC